MALHVACWNVCSHQKNHVTFGLRDQMKNLYQKLDLTVEEKNLCSVRSAPSRSRNFPMPSREKWLTTAACTAEKLLFRPHTTRTAAKRLPATSMQNFHCQSLSSADGERKALCFTQRNVYFQTWDTNVLCRRFVPLLGEQETQCSQILDVLPEVHVHPHANIYRKERIQFETIVASAARGAQLARQDLPLQKPN